MKIQDYLKRIKKIDYLIRMERTGRPVELAQKIGLAESTLYNYINFMRDSGAPIAYSKKQGTYYYRYEVEFNYGFSVANSD